jgi:hypothetical protein
MEEAHQACAPQEINSLGACTIDILPIAPEATPAECPSPQSPESLLSELAFNTSVTIESVGLIPFAFKDPQSEAASREDREP